MRAGPEAERGEVRAGPEAEGGGEGGCTERSRLLPAA